MTADNVLVGLSRAFPRGSYLSRPIARIKERERERERERGREREREPESSSLSSSLSLSSSYAPRNLIGSADSTCDRRCLNASEMIRSHARANVSGIFVIYYHSLLFVSGLCRAPLGTPQRHSLSLSLSLSLSRSLALRAIVPRNYSGNARRRDTAVKICAREWKSGERATLARALSLSLVRQIRARQKGTLAEKRELLSRRECAVRCADSNGKETVKPSTSADCRSPESRDS